MKVKNNTNIDITSDLQKVTEYFKTRVPFPITFEVENTNIHITIKPYLERQGFSPQTGKPATIKYYGLKNISFPDEIFVYNMDKFLMPENSVITSYADDTLFIQIAINQYSKDKGDIWQKFTHEIMHYLCYKANKAGFKFVDEMDMTKALQAFYKNDDPYALDGNYALTLKNLQPYFKSLTKVGYKYFKENEVKGLKPELVSLLDKMRGECNFAFIINSGFRTVKENLQVGGVEESAHLTGEAVDLKITDSNKREKLIKTALFNGINRIGVAKTFIHLDISKTLPQNVMWLY